MLNDTKQLREDVNDDELLKSANHSMINNSLLEIVHFNSDNNANCNDVDNEMIVRVDSNESKNKKDKAKSKERDAKDVNTINTTRKESKKKNDNVSNATIKKILNTTKMKLKENNFHKISTPIAFGQIQALNLKNRNEKTPERSINTNLNTLKTFVKNKFTNKKKPKQISLSKFSISDVKKNILSTREKSSEMIQQSSKYNNTHLHTQESLKNEIVKISSAKYDKKSSDKTEKDREKDREREREREIICSTRSLNKSKSKDKSIEKSAESKIKVISVYNNKSKPITNDNAKNNNEFKITFSLNIDKAVSAKHNINNNFNNIKSNKNNEPMTQRESLVSARINSNGNK